MVTGIQYYVKVYNFIAIGIKYNVIQVPSANVVKLYKGIFVYMFLFNFGVGMKSKR